MGERLKRRKQKSESREPARVDVSQEAPLQPAYFDATDTHSHGPGSGEAQTISSQSQHSLVADAERQADTPAAEASHLSESQPGAASPSPRRRRRRGRGGRGRGRSTQAASAAPFEPTLPAETPRPVAPVVATAAPAERALKGVVVLAIGLPGSGKSSWFKRHHIRALSSDLVRDLLFDDPTEQRYQDLVFSNLRSMLKARMIARRPMNYVDATNLTPHDRRSWIKLAGDYAYDVHAVFFDVPLEVCMERNQRRHRVVPEEAMRRMAAKFRPPSFDEGFSKITVVRVKKKETAL
ncbi:MAG: ATP-binding protein [Acidobacteria bacterium]|nr:ATP-binding protein [Acidobacteriota bacterium]